MSDSDLALLDSLNIDESTPPENALKRIDEYIDKTYWHLGMVNKGAMYLIEMQIHLLSAYDGLKHGH